MDAAAPAAIEERVRRLAEEIRGVLYVEKCRVRKSGMNYLIDLHVTVDGQLSVREGHRIAQRVKDHLIASDLLPVGDVSVHLEPDFL